MVQCYCDHVVMHLCCWFVRKREERARKVKEMRERQVEKAKQERQELERRVAEKRENTLKQREERLKEEREKQKQRYCLNLNYKAENFLFVHLSMYLTIDTVFPGLWTHF